MPQAIYHFSLNTEKHAHIIAWLDRQPNISAAVRAACEAVASNDATLDDVLRAIEDLKRLGVIVRNTADDNGGDEPAEAVLALDELGR